MKELINNFSSIATTDSCAADIKNIIQTARSVAYKKVNSVMTQAYWYIGRRIVLQEQGGAKRAEYGKFLLKQLSEELSAELNNPISSMLLKNCRTFYLAFPDEEKSSTLWNLLNWSQLRLIMRLNTEKERNFYIENCSNGAWSVRELERNIKTDMYHRVVSNQLEDSVTDCSENGVLDYVKDPYILEFLNVKNNPIASEKDLESRLITDVQKFLLELGKGFSFVDRQMHISTETSDFYIDLVFYNYFLKCFVLVDLKIDKLSHQDIGQMDMYVRMFDDLKRIPGDNPTIGVILCTDKEETIVKYSVLNESKQIFASKYMTYLPTEEELSKELERNRNYYASH